MKAASKPLIGFIGQGWIGKNYSDDLERRGYSVVRYAKEEPYTGNKDAIAMCDIVFIAVPTPTTPKGFDDSIIRNVITCVGKGKIAVIKSTILPEMTKKLQKDNPDIFVMHSPEFLSEATAAYDAAHPDRNIIGIPVANALYKEKAELVMSVLPKAPYTVICDSTSAEFIKYGRNVLGYFRIMFTNMLYDLSQTTTADWQAIQDAMSADPDNGPKYMKPVHKTGRGAGGHCFIKDFAAFSQLYKEKVGDTTGNSILDSLEEKNLSLLLSSRKDLDLLEDVYGKIKSLEPSFFSKVLKIFLFPFKRLGF